MIRVLFIEASSGGVVGGSLTGLYHQIRGLDRSRFAPAIVLYEAKTIESDLRVLEVPVYHVDRRRLPKEHALLGYEGYRKAKKTRAFRAALSAGRQALRLLTEELPAALRLAQIIRTTKTDVVHLGNGVRANFDGILACMLTRTPMLCHVKGFEKYSARERWIAPRIDALVPMTQAVAQHCVASGIRAHRTAVIYDALDEQGYHPKRESAEVRRELGVDGGPCAGVAGNIQEWKGQLVLVEAMAKVRRELPSAQALIIGGVHKAGADYHRRLEHRIAELQLAGGVRVTGFRSDIADVMGALDIVVHTSVRPEPFGRVILEGMLLGKPVIASAAGGVPELIRDGETGFLVPPGNVEALAARLILLMAQPELRHEIGQRARRWALDEFSLERHVRLMSDLYENLVRSH
ncbi:MAG TPA: glycosyltransferase family 4 protein [Terriglobales bacterium]|nr:glycosyltransferase family 4 protein [Terriglobales bacterium]